MQNAQLSQRDRAAGCVIVFAKSRRLELGGVTAEELRANIGWKSAISLQRGPVDPRFQVEAVVLHQPFFFSEN